MKKILYTVSLLFIAGSFWAYENLLSPSVSPLQVNYFYTKGQAVSLTYEGFSLVADSGLLLHDLQIEFGILKKQQVAPMPSNMVNVTGDLAGAYRLLPNGVHFSEPAVITIPYDARRIPTGYRPSDLYSYYYDEEAAQWKQLERVAVDTIAHTISSYTTHFTDFADALIKLPEMPESKAFVPTAMTDLPDVNPLQGIPMIAAPQVNNMGTAELSYPIELPAGRLGLQPNIDLHYSSAGGNGVLGIGWSMQIPAITIDTRWGVPRYDDLLETEAYLCNGEQLLQDLGEEILADLPNQSTAFRKRQCGQTIFYARNAKTQNRHIRYGYTTKDYWWEVTQTNGTKYYYGYNPIEGKIDEDALVRTEKGAIAEWNLSMVIDIYGNYIRYQYLHDNNVNYVKQIDYTGNIMRGTPSYYSVGFGYDNRSDAQITGRLGVLQTTKKCLHCISIYAEKEIISQYQLNYEATEGSLYKSRLTDIVKYDLPCCEDCKWEEAKLDERSWDTLKTEENYTMFESFFTTDKVEANPSSKTEFRYQDAIISKLLYNNAPKNIVLGDNISRNYSRGWNVGGTGTFGIDSKVFTTAKSAGGNYTYNRNTGRVQTMLIDLNGDRHPDFVTVEDNNIYYQKQNQDGTFDSSKHKILDGSCLVHSVSKSHNFGVQADFGWNISVSPNLSKTYTDRYFSDINNDGLPDLITPDGILYNILQNGVPNFSQWDGKISIPVQNSCCGMCYRTGEMSPHLECENIWVLDTIVAVSYQRISEKAEDKPYEDKIPEGSTKFPKACIEYQEKEEPFSLNFNDTEYTPSVLSISQDWYESDYKVIQDGDSLRVYRLETICKDSTGLPEVDIVRVWVAPSSGSIRIHSAIQLQEDTSWIRQQSRYADGVKYAIQLCHSSVDQHTFDISNIDTLFLLHKKDISADNYEPDSVDLTFQDVHQGDVLMFRLMAKDNSQYDNTRWTQHIEYTTELGAIPGSYYSENDYACYGENIYMADTTVQIRYGYQATNTTDQAVAVRILSNNPRLTHTDTILAGVEQQLVQYMDTIDKEDELRFELVQIGEEEPLWSDIHIFPTLTRYHSIDTVSDTVSFAMDLHNASISQVASGHTKQDSLYHSLFGLLHKGWGYFGYNNRDHDSIINIHELTPTTHRFATVSEYSDKTSTLPDTSVWRGNMDSIMSAVQQSVDSLPDPLNNLWIEMIANSETEEWIAYGRLGAIGRIKHTVSPQLVIDQVDDMDDYQEYDSGIPQNDPKTKTIVRKASRTTSVNISAGKTKEFKKTPYSVGGNINASASWNYVDIDYMDMNGDGYPDAIGKSSIQYSMPWGGVGTEVTPIHRKPFLNHSYSLGVGASGEEHTKTTETSNNIKAMREHAVSIGASASLAWNHTSVTYMDVNADGLPDVLDANTNQIWYNIGHRFVGPYTFNKLHISESLSTGFSINGGFSKDQYSLSFGLAVSQAETFSLANLIDINGDGLLDYVTVVGNNLNVQFGQVSNAGTPSFSAHAITCSSVIPLQQSTSIDKTHNLGLTVGVPFFGSKLCMGMHRDPKSESWTEQTYQMMDMNADGYVDIVVQEGGSLKVWYNRNGSVPVNMLTQIVNPTGQELHIDYTLMPSSVDKPGCNWVMSAITDQLPIAYDFTFQLKKSFTYSGPHYDNKEKIDYGYRMIETIDNAQKMLVEEYDNRFFVVKGEKLSETLYDMNKQPYIRHSKEIRFSHKKDDSPAEKFCNDNELYTALEGYWTEYFDINQGDKPVITTHYKLKYDKFNNLIEQHEDGDIVVNGDEWVRYLTYSQPETRRWQHNLISCPASELVVDVQQNVLRFANFHYNAYGLRSWFERIDTIGHSHAIYQFAYDRWGNMLAAVFPENHKGQRAWIAMTHDPILHAYTATIRNQFNEQTSMQYDYRWGRMTQQRDPAGNMIQYRYDHMGRLTDIVAPQEQQRKMPYTIHYSYRRPFYSEKEESPWKWLHVVKLSYSEKVNGADVSIYDSRGYLIQNKHLASVNNQLCWVADGIRHNDAYYRPLQSSLPFISVKVPVEEYDYQTYSGPMLKQFYDVMDREVCRINFDGTAKTFDYGYDMDHRHNLRFRNDIVDENKITTSQWLTPQSWVVQSMAGDQSTTTFDYNSIGELIHVTDPDALETIYHYDALGNRIGRDHPDAGVDTWHFAPSGVLIAHQNTKLYQQKLSVQYDYDFNRPTKIYYPTHSGDSVSFKYNAAGQLIERSDACGWERFRYDPLGQVIDSERRLVIPSEDKAIHVRHSFFYDSFGRMRNIVYPDGDEVMYQYESLSGELTEISHQLLNQSPKQLMSDIIYNESGQTIQQTFGNKVESLFIFDPLTQRLTKSQLKDIPIQCYLQSLDYTYDPVGNIVQVEQTEPSISSLGGPYKVTHQYDDQYRLISAKNQNSPYLLDFSATYSPSGRFGHNYCATNPWMKNLHYGYVSNTHQPRAIFDGVKGETWNLFWDENGNLSTIWNCRTGQGRFHEWDEENRLRSVIDDNMGGLYGYDGTGQRVWKMWGMCSQTGFNGNQPDYLFIPDQVVAYPSPYITFSREGYSKHYYMGSTLIATAIGQGGLSYQQHLFEQLSQDELKRNNIFWGEYNKVFDAPIHRGKEDKILPINDKQEFQYFDECGAPIGFNLTTKNRVETLEAVLDPYQAPCGQPEEIFYRHTDHLGSATWITDSTGNPVQYMHYAPYGELMENKTLWGYDERFKFTGKERDAESGYDFFGARYYSSLVDFWFSVDPLADKYPGNTPYMYCLGNPLIYYDPDGRSTYTDVDGNVTEVRDDNNSGVYRWNPQTKQYDMMGSSWHPLSFCNQSKYNDEGIVTPQQIRIDFGSTELGDAINSALSENPSLLQYAKNAKSGGIWDLKAHYQDGSLVNGKYASPRDAGNMLAGAIKYRSNILAPIVQYGYGAYNMSGNSLGKSAALIIGNLGVMMQSVPAGISAAVLIYNGEDKLTQRSIDIGYKHIR